MTTAVQRWLDHLEARNLSPNTITTYRRTLRTFPHLADADVETAEAWWESRRGLSPASRCNELAAVRGFYKWAMVHDLRTDDPTRRIVAPNVPKGLPHPMSRVDLRHLLEAGTLSDELRRCIALGAYAGLRISETAALEWSDVDREFNRLRVHGKGAKDRLVGLSPILLDHLLPDTGGNVVTGGTGTYRPDTLQRKVNRAIRTAGINETYHSCRHRYGTVALAGTDNLLAVSRAMGHSKPETTAIYAAATDSDLDLIAAVVTR